MVSKILTKFEVNWTSTSREHLGGEVILSPRPQSDTADLNSEVEIELKGQKLILVFTNIWSFTASSTYLE